MQQARYYLLGESAVVLELEAPITLESQQRIWGVAQRMAALPAVNEVVPGMNNLTLLLHPEYRESQEMLQQLQQEWENGQSLIITPRHIDIPVIYGAEYGPDLEEVARHADLSVRQVVECHSSAPYVVYFLGFQPGFPYLGGMPVQLSMPRRAEPRLQIAAGSVGIGGSQTGVYPQVAPGGWQLIGRTSLSLFIPQNMPPTLLQPGDNVRFVPQKEGVC